MIAKSLDPVGFGLGILALVACAETSTEPKLTDPLTSAVTALADVPNAWITRAEIPRVRDQFVGAAVTNAAGRSTVYIVDASGRAGTLQAYDVATNTWSERFPAIPLESRHYDFNGAAATNGKLYVSGGKWDFRGDRGCASDLRRFDRATRTWSVISRMPTTGGSGVSGVINGQLYILTGCPGSDDDGNPYVPLAFYRFNPGTNQWATLANPVSGHVHGMAAVMGGKFYVVGGEDQANLLEVYDAGTNKWTRKARMPLGQFAAGGRWGGAGVALGGKLHVVGGVQRDIDGKFTAVSTHNVYDPATNTWSVKRRLPTGRAGIVGSRVLVNGQARIELVGNQLGLPTNLQYIP
jgi:N-acetylneuraminic acid mutarotase